MDQDMKRLPLKTLAELLAAGPPYKFGRSVDDDCQVAWNHWRDRHPGPTSIPKMNGFPVARRVADMLDAACLDGDDVVDYKDPNDA